MYNDFDQASAIREILRQLDFLRSEELGRNEEHLQMIGAIKQYIQSLDHQSNNHFNHVLKAPMLRIVGLCNVLCLLTDQGLYEETEFKEIVQKICEESESLLRVLEKYFGYEAGANKKFNRKMKKK